METEQTATEAADPKPEKVYPTEPDGEGYFFESENDEILEICTRKYDNGKYSKRLILSTSAVAVVHELMGNASIHAGRLCKGNQDHYPAAVAALATKIDETPWTMEDLLDKMKMKDYTRIIAASQSLNF